MNNAVEIKGSQFCGQCGHKNANESIYCSDCGHSLEKVTDKPASMTASVTKKIEEKTKSIDLSNVGNATKNFISTDLFKTAIASAIIAIIVVFLGTFIFSKVAEKNIFSSFNAFGSESPMMMYEEFLDEAAYYLDIDEDDLNPFKTVNLLMNANFVDQQFVLKQTGDYSNESINFDYSFGLTFLILLPILGLFLAGFYVRTKNKSYSITEKLTIAVVIGLIYGLFLSIVSFFAGFSFDVTEGSERIAFDYDFSFFQALINGFVLGFFFSFVGAYEREEKSALPYAKYVQTSTAAFLSIFILLGAVTAIVSFLFINDSVEMRFLINDAPLIGVLVFLVQFSFYLINIAIGNAFKLKVVEDYSGFTPEAKYTLFGPSGTDAREIFSFLDGKLIFLYILALLIAGTFVWIGKKYITGNIVTSTIIFSALFAFLFTFISVNSSITLNGMVEYGDRMEVLFGFTVMRTFIASFLFSGVFSFIGAKFLGKR